MPEAFATPSLKLFILLKAIRPRAIIIVKM
jgi:hypothetical protein